MPQHLKYLTPIQEPCEKHKTRMPGDKNIKLGNSRENKGEMNQLGDI